MTDDGDEGCRFYYSTVAECEGTPCCSTVGPSRVNAANAATAQTTFGWYVVHAAIVARKARCLSHRCSMNGGADEMERLMRRDGSFGANHNRHRQNGIAQRRISKKKCANYEKTKVRLRVLFLLKPMTNPTKTVVVHINNRQQLGNHHQIKVSIHLKPH